jgi:hypothetical protein
MVTLYKVEPAMEQILSHLGEQHMEEEEEGISMAQTTLETTEEVVAVDVDFRMVVVWEASLLGALTGGLSCWEELCMGNLVVPDSMERVEAVAVVEELVAQVALQR